MTKMTKRTCAALLVAFATPAAMPAHAQQPATTAPVLEPAAAAALNRMGFSLRQLKQFEVTSESRLERSFESGPTLEFRQDSRFLVQMPDRMMADITTDRTHRRVFYDGKEMTILGMTAGKYVTVPMEGSISEVLTRAYNNLGLDFPLQDLFRWGSDSAVNETPTEGFRVGDSMVRGQKVGHYAFRMPDVDFQIWMTEGDQPLPLRMVITGRETPRLRYSTDIIWNLTPAITATSFAFKPRPGDQPIAVETVKAAVR